LSTETTAEHRNGDNSSDIGLFSGAAMQDEKRLIIHFNSGSKLELAFPDQVGNSSAGLLEAFKRMMGADKLAVQTEDRLLVISWSSIQHVELSPPPTTTPFGTIQKARIIE
jgi:hypothetical protein